MRRHPPANKQLATLIPGVRFELPICPWAHALWVRGCRLDRHFPTSSSYVLEAKRSNINGVCETGKKVITFLTPGFSQRPLYEGAYWLVAWQGMSAQSSTFRISRPFLQTRLRPRVCAQFWSGETVNRRVKNCGNRHLWLAKSM